MALRTVLPPGSKEGRLGGDHRHDEAWIEVREGRRRTCLSNELASSKFVSLTSFLHRSGDAQTEAASDAATSEMCQSVNLSEPVREEGRAGSAAIIGMVTPTWIEVWKGQIRPWPNLALRRVGFIEICQPDKAPLSCGGGWGGSKISRAGLLPRPKSVKVSICQTGYTNLCRHHEEAKASSAAINGTMDGTASGWPSAGALPLLRTALYMTHHTLHAQHGP